MSTTASRRTKASPIEEATARSQTGLVDHGALDRRLGYWLRRAQIAVFRDFFEAFERHDIRPGQYSILTIIEGNPRLRQGEVGEALGIKRTNFVAMVDELERRGLVRRAPAPKDRRSHALVLTLAGKRLMAELHAVSERHERVLIDAIGLESYQNLFAPLKALARLGAGKEEE